MNIEIAGSRLRAENCIKYLGIRIDNTLRFNDNIEYVCMKIARKVGRYCPDSEMI